MLKKTRNRAWLLGLVLLATPQPISAQLPKLPGGATTELAQDDKRAPSEDEIRARRQEIRAAIDDLRRHDATTPEATDSASAKLRRLEMIERLLELQLTELERVGEMSEEPLPSDLETRFGHAPPFSIAELDLLLDEVEAASAAREVSEGNLQEAMRAVDHAAQRRTQLERESQLTDDPSADFELKKQAAIEQHRLRRMQLHAADLDHGTRRVRERRLESLVLELRGWLVPAAGELDASLAALEARATQLDEQLDAARQRLSSAENRRSAAREQVELNAAPDAGQTAKAEASHLEVAASRLEVELLEKQRDRIDMLGTAWRLRFRILADKVSARHLADAAKDLASQLDELDRERRLVEARLAERRLALGVLRDRQLNEPADSVVSRWLDRQEEHVHRTVELHGRELEDLAAATRLASRLRNEIETRVGTISVGERLGLLWDRLGTVWRYKLAAADGQPITIGKILVALLLILIGYFVSKVLSRRLGQSILPRFGLTRGAAVAFQTLTYYGLLAIFFLWALRLVNIPLTVFTVVGGVLAIGIGFGSQNIMNNFISGLIILAEHPIKVGDLVDVDGIFGQVERIGPRSSRIRAGDNTHVIVPNSAFLENNVLNWTVSDDVIRTSVDIGVAYGSPAEQVAEGLKRAITEEPSILEEPAPEILFMDFGDNALAFRAYFWVRVARPLDRIRVQSRLRFHIDRVFHEMGLVIAFPQRDVHLDSSTPVEVRLVENRPE